MGVIINQGNNGFKLINQSKYVDKTGFIDFVNHSLETRNMFFCICLPSGFGKTTIAQTLAAYYDLSCDSHELFDDKKIAESENYEANLNQYNVVYVDMNYFANAKAHHSYHSFSDLLRDSLVTEIFGVRTPKRREGLRDVEDVIERELLEIVDRYGGKKFIFIIDGWDVALCHPETSESDFVEDLSLWKTWFNSAPFTSKAVAGVVITGSLPFRRDVFPFSRLDQGRIGSLPVFREYSLLQPGPFAEYFGFSEEDVKGLAGEQSVDELKRIYGGYAVENAGAVYNPASTLRAIEEKKRDSFWTDPYSSNVVADLVVNDVGGLDEAVAKLLEGASLNVGTLSLSSWFKGSLDPKSSADEILTLMIYLGLLTYDAKSQSVRIPNEEVNRELRRIVEQARRKQASKKSNN